MMNNIETKRERAKKHVAEIKGFLRHLKIFIIVNGLLYLLHKGWLQPLLPDGFPQEAFYFDWVHVNTMFWGLILVVHALTLYRHKMSVLKNWEAKQIRKYMEEDRNTTFNKK